jgi:cobyrinic acid a,c-diamide synthase
MAGGPIPMLRLPRLAVGSIDQNVDSQPLSWALMTLLSSRGHRVQHFYSKACFPRLDGAPAATGVSSRHLDSWLMTPEVCREVFTHAGGQDRLCVVEGFFDGGRGEVGSSATSAPRTSLNELCEILDLPRMVIVDVAQLDGCNLPRRPQQAEALLLDNVKDASHAARWQTTLEALWKIPVLGALEALPQTRRALAALPRGGAPTKELCATLAASLTRYCQPKKISELASRRDFPVVRPYLFEPIREQLGEGPRVAVAFDEAFRCYFPDALELLELHGATVVDFSPLRDECLPTDVDLVYLGCGHPERYAARLAANHCMLFSMREHLCAGRRIYAEGGGLAYLCEYLMTPTGEQLPMVGAFEATASFSPQPTAPRPVELTLDRQSWLGKAGAPLRGYLNSNWRIEPHGPVDSLASTASAGDSTADGPSTSALVRRYAAIGSLVHLNFAAQTELLMNFTRPAFEPIGVY